MKSDFQKWWKPIRSKGRKSFVKKQLIIFLSGYMCVFLLAVVFLGKVPELLTFKVGGLGVLLGTLTGVFGVINGSAIWNKCEKRYKEENKLPN